MVTMAMSIFTIQLLLMTRVYAQPSELETTQIPDEIISGCRIPLGMESLEIPDEAITASSSYDEKSVGPLSSRIRTERNGGAWCPKAQISQDVYEYLEFDLGEVKVITMVETQGRFGQGHGMEYAPHYLLDYQREAGGQWIRYHNHQRQQIIIGNTNTYVAETRELHPPIIAQRIRIVPYSTRPRTICMRIELYGCQGQGIMSYSMPQGESRGAGVDFFDRTYDGKEEDGYLSGGLGQLTDYTFGESSFRLDPLRTGFKGYGWIGWRNDSREEKPVELVFHFDKSRAFDSVRLHCSNQFEKGIRVFQKAEVYVAKDVESLTSNPVHYEHASDNSVNLARNITIPLNDRRGQYVKLVLHFNARWLMISELSFHTVMNGTGTGNDPAVGSSTIFASSKRRDRQPVDDHERLLARPNRTLSVRDEPRNTNSTESNDTLQIATGFTPVTTSGDIQKAVRRYYNMDDTFIGIIIGSLIGTILLASGLVVMFYCRKGRKKYSKAPTNSFPSDVKDANAFTYGKAPAKLANGNVYNPVATNDSANDRETEMDRIMNGEKIQREPSGHGIFISSSADKSPEDIIKKIPPDSGHVSPDFAVATPLVTKPPPGSSHHWLLPEVPLPGPPPPPIPPVAEIPTLQAWSGSSAYCAMYNPHFDPHEEVEVVEFPREKLKFIEKIGEGKFGEIHLCSAQSTGTPFLAAVKMLRPDAPHEIRGEFHSEKRLLSLIKDSNICQMLGVCTEGEPLALVLEYTKYGDMHQFLLAHVPDTTLNEPNSSHNQLSYGCLIYMATQIASGMEYMETLNVVHRDLAARNCLVGDLYGIKISDFGMSRSVYQSDYYRHGGHIMPIRWMAPEAVFMGDLSSKSDVWSFAVTLWEILTFAIHRPFDELSDDDVIGNHAHCYHGDGRHVKLAQPSICPKEIYDLISECWNRDESMRPTFREIHMFLSRKNMGYDPREERQPVIVTSPLSV